MVIHKATYQTPLKQELHLAFTLHLCYNIIKYDLSLSYPIPCYSFIEGYTMI